MRWNTVGDVKREFNGFLPASLRYLGEHKGSEVPIGDHVGVSALQGRIEYAAHRRDRLVNAAKSEDTDPKHLPEIRAVLKSHYNMVI